MASQSISGGRSRATNATPLATVVANTAKGNRRRAARGRVCSNTSPQPKTNIPRGRPWTAGWKMKKAVLKPAAARASALSNHHGLARSRRNHRATLSMTCRYRHRATVTSTHRRQPLVHPEATSQVFHRCTPSSRGPRLVECVSGHKSRARSGRSRPAAGIRPTRTWPSPPPPRCSSPAWCQRQPGDHPKAPTRTGANLQLAIEGGHPLPHADQTVTGPRPAVAGRWHGAPAIVDDLHRDVLVAVADCDLGVGWAGVLDYVGQGLLDDPIGG